MRKETINKVHLEVYTLFCNFKAYRLLAVDDEY